MFQPTTFERRESLRILVATRWVLVAAAAFVVNVRTGLSLQEWLLLDVLLGISAVLNAVLFAGISQNRSFPLALPVAAGVYDSAAVIASSGLIDGFGNSAFVLIYPALVGFSVAFSGRASVLYGLATAGAYTAVATSTHDSFSWSSAGDEHTLVVRLASMAGCVLAANMIVHIERSRRQRAVAAEATRQLEVQALQRRTVDMERAAAAERSALVREIHDGLAQGVYMLSLGLETTAADLAGATVAEATRARVDSLVRVSKQTLLETRNLLFDLDRVMLGEHSLSGLLSNHAGEFTAVSGIPVDLCVEGSERELGPALVAHVYRMVQEALSNVFRHSAATHVGLRLTYGPDWFELCVEDNGRGFEHVRAGGRGLLHMRQRAEAVAGELRVDSEPGTGTRLSLHAPYEVSDASDSRPPGG